MLNAVVWNEWSNFVYVLLVGLVVQQLIKRLVFPWILRRLQKRNVPEVFTNTLIDSVAKPLNFLIIMTTLYAGVNVSPLKDLYPDILLRIYRSTIIIAFYGVFYNLADNSNGHLKILTKKIGWKFDPLLLNLGSSVFRLVIVVFAFLNLAREWNYDMIGVIAGLGLGGLALALAAKDSLANMFGGFVILTDKPFTIGNSIKAAGYDGTVEDVTFRSTRIRTADQGIVYVPNSDLANVPLINFSKRKKRRVSLTIGLDYSTTKEQLASCVADIRTMLEKDNELTHEAGDILAAFSGFGESSLNIFIIYFTVTSTYVEHMRVNHDVNLRIMEIIAKAGAKISLPGRSIYVKDAVTIKGSVKELLKNKNGLA